MTVLLLFFLFVFVFCDWISLDTPLSNFGMSLEDSLTKISIFSESDRIIQQTNGHLYRGSERFRIWGINLFGSSAILTHDDANTLVDRLTRTGINTVRFSKIDSIYPNGLISDSLSLTLDTTALDRFSYLIARLADHGIYSYIVLHSSLRFSENLQINDTHLLPNDLNNLVSLFHPEIQTYIKDYIFNIMSYSNPYRSNTILGNDNCILAVQIEENTNSFWKFTDQEIISLPPHYYETLQNIYRSQMLRNHGSTEEIDIYWKGDDCMNFDDDIGTCDNSITLPSWINNNNWDVTTNDGSNVDLIEESVPYNHIKADNIAVPSSSPYQLNIRIGPISIQSGLQILHFTCASVTSPRILQIEIQETDRTPITANPYIVYLTPTVQDYSISMYLNSDPNAYISFILGDSSESVLFMNISMCTSVSSDDTKHSYNQWNIWNADSLFTNSVFSPYEYNTIEQRSYARLISENEGNSDGVNYTFPYTSLNGIRLVTSLYLRSPSSLSRNECPTMIDGRDYHGNVNITESMKDCLIWDNDDIYNSLNFINHGLGYHSYCRNPLPNERNKPWCLTDTGWEYCNIPPCQRASVTFECATTRDHQISTFTSLDYLTVSNEWELLSFDVVLSPSSEPYQCTIAITAFNDDNGALKEIHISDVYLSAGGCQGLGIANIDENIDTVELYPRIINSTGAGYLLAVSNRRLIERIQTLSKIENGYYSTLYYNLRDDIHYSGLIFGSPTSQLSLFAQYSQNNMDGIVETVMFPNTSFQDSISINELLFGLQSVRISKQLFILCDVTTQYPSSFDIESVPIISYYAASQDWDGLIWSHYDNPSKWVFMQAGASIFRDFTIPFYYDTLVVSMLTEPITYFNYTDVIVGGEKEYGSTPVTEINLFSSFYVISQTSRLIAWKDSSVSNWISSRIEIDFIINDHNLYPSAQSLFPFFNCISDTSYKGSQDKTQSGIQCQSWSLQTPHIHPFSPDEYSYDGLSDLSGNLCRNPNSTDLGPWCYTNESSIESETCGIEKCTDINFYTKDTGSLIFIGSKLDSYNLPNWLKNIVIESPVNVSDIVLTIAIHKDSLDFSNIMIVTLMTGPVELFNDTADVFIPTGKITLSGNLIDSNKIYYITPLSLNGEFLKTEVIRLDIESEINITFYGDSPWIMIHSVLPSCQYDMSSYNLDIEDDSIDYDLCSLCKEAAPNNCKATWPAQMYCFYDEDIDSFWCDIKKNTEKTVTIVGCGFGVIIILFIFFYVRHRYFKNKIDKYVDLGTFSLPQKFNTSRLPPKLSKVIAEINESDIELKKTLCQKPTSITKLGVLHGQEVVIKYPLLTKSDDITESVRTSIVINIDPGEKKRLESKRIERMAKMPSHPLICQFMGSFPASNGMAILYRFLPDGSLPDYMSKNADMSFGVIMGLLRDVAEGLFHLHSNGLLHRNLCAKNVMVDIKSYKRIKAIFTDYGFMKTSDDMIRWRSPESLKDNDDFTDKSDIWAFAVLAWEILTNCKNKPFPTMDNETVKKKVMTNSMNIIQFLPELTPNPLKKVLSMCSQNDPGERPSSEQLLGHLELISLWKS